VIAFDADVLIYAVDDSNPIAYSIRKLINNIPGNTAGIGSVLLIPETLIKPFRIHSESQIDAISEILAQLTLVPVSREIATKATQYGAKYRIKTPDAIHLATAVHAGADYFLTNNRKDFSKAISEMNIVFPAEIPNLLTEYGLADG